MGIEDTKDKIVNVATKLFSRFGFHKTSMDEIAKIARKAKGSLYYHFSSKEELFKEVVSNEINSFKSQLDLIIEDESLNAGAKLEKYLIKRMEVLNSATNYHETIKADFFEHFDFVDEIREDLENWEKVQLKKILDQGMAGGEFSQLETMDVLVDMLIMILKGLELPFYLQDKYGKYSPHFKSLMKIVTKGLS